jgi:16S rRNA (guanine966-N2)-methyltransferase
MRVIAGSLGGRSLVAPRGTGTRPTSDRVREALFSILGDVAGDAVLDLFAGSGALSIEALSRGAATATLVDSAATSIAAVRANVGALGLQAVEVRRADARVFLRDARRAGRQYDLVFLDPPYRDAAELAADLSQDLASVLAPRARIVGESDRRAPLDLAFPLQSERRYGDTLIRIHRP